LRFRAEAQVEKDFHQFNFRFHKEKEMLDFRKSLLLLAILCVVGSVASAQVPAAFQCTANAAVTPLVRAEGLAELVGDLVLNCNGGTPTGPGVPVPQVNFRIFLNVNVTSRLLDGNWNEAILAIDDPAPANQRPCPENNCSLTGVGFPGINYSGAGTAVNVFQGTWISPNAVEWLGVPVDPPGTAGTRVIRITNVRANANQLGVSGTLIPSNIIMNISATGTTSVPINNPTQVVAFVQDGMSFSVVENTSFLQCETAGSGADTRPCEGDFFLRYQENFASAFKQRFFTQQNQNAGSQNIFGAAYNTENGFHNTMATFTNGHNINAAGIAQQGTRLLARFNSVPAGATVRVWSRAIFQDPFSTPPAWPASCPTMDIDDDATVQNFWRVNDADSVGAGGTNTTTSEWRAVSLSGGTGTATWEVTPFANGARGDNPFANDVVYFAVDVTYTANTTAGVPSLGTASVNGSFAPISTVVLASNTAPHPRFFDDSTPQTAFSISSCATNLLWPYVTNQAGFDTGLVIANTSRDPFGTATQEGACTINYYGYTTGGGAAPPAATTPRVPAGQHAVWTLSSGGTVLTGGGTIPAAPGFQGYIIAQCNFQYAHGYAFISDVGATRLAQGYLALVMDAGADSLPRSGSESEPLLH
jgi:hypothetical protein